jgi:hypothetical protein
MALESTCLGFPLYLLVLSIVTGQYFGSNA